MGILLNLQFIYIDFLGVFLYIRRRKRHEQSLSTDLFYFISWLLHNRNAFRRRLVKRSIRAVKVLYAV